MARRKKTTQGPKKLDSKPKTLKALDPKLDEVAEYNRQKVESILKRRESLDSAKELLGWDIVASTPEGLKRVRIARTRSFSGFSPRTNNRESMSAEAGNVYIMKQRAARFFNVSTGREGKPACVHIEEAVNLENGKRIKNNELLRTLGLMESDGQPIFSERTAIVPGVKLDDKSIERLSPSAVGASANTTGVFQAHFSEEEMILSQVKSAVELYTRKD